MSIIHHPDDVLLLAYASGVAREAEGLIVATHMTFCARCRAGVAAMEKIGGGLLEDLPPQSLAPDALNRALAKLETAGPFERPRRDTSRDGTPDVLRRYLGGDLSDVRWRRMGPNLAYVPLLRRGATRVRLLRGAPGADAGAHSHRGLEYTLVLRGGYTDVTGSYGPGDLQMADGSVSHSPIADPGEDCINLAVTTDSLRFENWIQKIAGPLFGF
jgi:putative transcriptional regulator